MGSKLSENIDYLRSLYFLIYVAFNKDFHTNKCIILFKVDDVFVTETDTSLTATAWNAIPIACAAVDTYARALVVAFES